MVTLPYPVPILYGKISEVPIYIVCTTQYLGTMQYDRTHSLLHLWKALVIHFDIGKEYGTICILLAELSYVDGDQVLSSGDLPRRSCAHAGRSVVDRTEGPMLPRILNLQDSQDISVILVTSQCLCVAEPLTSNLHEAHIPSSAPCRSHIFGRVPLSRSKRYKLSTVTYIQSCKHRYHDIYRIS